MKAPRLTAIEWGLIAALIAVAIIGAVRGLHRDPQDDCQPTFAGENGVFTVPAGSCVLLIDKVPAAEEGTAVSPLT